MFELVQATAASAIGIISVPLLIGRFKRHRAWLHCPSLVVKVDEPGDMCPAVGTCSPRTHTVANGVRTSCTGAYLDPAKLENSS